MASRTKAATMSRNATPDNRLLYFFFRINEAVAVRATPKAIQRMAGICGHHDPAQMPATIHASAIRMRMILIT